MVKKSQAAPRWYRGADVPMSAIRRFARAVAARFQPEKIILFGSYAYGKPHADSDVDILVVMPARNQRDQVSRFTGPLSPHFPCTFWFARRKACNGGWPKLSRF
jgi:predicted nucleotidyltransferase